MSKSNKSNETKRFTDLSKLGGLNESKESEELKKLNKLNKLDYVKEAEKVISNLSRNKNNGVIRLSKNKIRNILSMINELYEFARVKREDEIDENLQSHIQYIKMKIIYDAGRETTVKEFLDKSKLIEYMDSIGKSRDELILFCHYMEALVAYHKYQTEEK